MKLKITLSVLSLVSLFVLSLPQQSMAEGDPLGLNFGAQTGLEATDPRVSVGRIINVALELLGTVALVLIIYAGAKWMTAGGNDDQIQDAQKILFASIVGLIIILSAYAISNYVVENIYEATQLKTY